MQPNLQYNLSANVLNTQGNFNSNQISPSQLMNRRPSSSTAALVTVSSSNSNQFHNQVSSLAFATGSIKTASSASTLTVNQTKNKSDHLSSSANHLSNLDPMNNYAGNKTELMKKTSSVTLVTNTSTSGGKQQFLDVNNNSNAYNNLRRKSSSALSNAPKFNRTLSLRSNSTNEAEITSNLNAAADIMLEQMNQMQPIQQNSLPTQSNLITSFQTQMQNIPKISTSNQATSDLLTRQPSIQMRSMIMKSTTDVDKQQQINKQINYSSSTSISSALATPLRRPSTQQQRCISAMDTFRRRPLSISANSCSSSDELTDTESLSKVTNSKNEVDSCIRGNKIIGEIKLNIVMTKGLLEIDIIEAKLHNPTNNPNKPG